MSVTHQVGFDVDCGIYEIKNTVSGKRYVGSTAHLSVRFLQHRSKLRQNTHDNKHLQNAWNKYGESSFVYKTLAVLERRELLSTEQRLLNQMKDSGEENYNIAPFANSGAKGRSPSKETREKQSISVKATYNQPGKREAHSLIIKKVLGNPEFLKKRGEAIKKAWAALDPETKKKHIAARRAPLDTAEMRQRLSQKMSDVLKKRYANQEYRDRNAAARRLVGLDPIWRAKMSLINTGRRHSEESKRKISEASNLSWQDPERKAKRIAKRVATLAARALRTHSPAFNAQSGL